MSELTICEMLEELSRAAEYEGSEVTESWASLVEGQTAADYGSDEFRKAYEKEVREQYMHFRDNFRFVTRTEEITYTDLEFIG